MYVLSLTRVTLQCIQEGKQDGRFYRQEPGRTRKLLEKDWEGLFQARAGFFGGRATGPQVNSRGLMRRLRMDGLA